MAESSSDPTKSPEWLDLQDAMFGSKLRNRIVACRKDLLELQDDFFYGAECTENEASGVDEWFEINFDMYMRHEVEHQKKPCLAGNVEYPPAALHPHNEVLVYHEMAHEFDQAFRDLYKNWRCIQLTENGAARGLYRYIWKQRASFSLTMVEIFLFFAYVIVPFAGRRYRAKQPSGYRTDDFLALFDLGLEVFDIDWFCDSDQIIWKALGERQSARLLRDQQLHLIEASMRSEMWEFWGRMSSNNDLYQQGLHKPDRRLIFEFSPPVVRFLQDLRSESIEARIMRYLHDGLFANLEVIAGIDAAERRYQEACMEVSKLNTGYLDCISRNKLDLVDFEALDDLERRWGELTRGFFDLSLRCDVRWLKRKLKSVLELERLGT